MIYGLIHHGSGLGNQLHRYIATRCLALDKGYDFGMIGTEFFKGKEFMNLDFGKPNDIAYDVEYPAGKVVVKNTPLWEEKTQFYNPEFNFVKDGSIIDGEFQSIQYFGHHLKEIDEWLRVEPIKVSDDVCVIGFRGGEFYTNQDLGLPRAYFDKGMEMMRGINPNMRFEVHTDDEVLAKRFFPTCLVIQDISINWRSFRYAKYAIIANSSFFILPRLLRDGVTIAPRGWARRNIKEWSRPDNYYRTFRYI